MSKRAGRHAQQANDFLQPMSPINVVATDVGTNRAFNNGAASVSFELPANSPAATSYTVTSSPGGYTATGSSSPITVTGLQSAASYTFTVTATNDKGTSQSSSASSPVTATTVPDVPSSFTAAANSGTNSDHLAWTAPANGGKAITNYHWSSNDAKSGDTASTSVDVGQEAGTAQTYQVYATNANGNGQPTAASGTVTSYYNYSNFYNFYNFYNYSNFYNFYNFYNYYNYSNFYNFYNYSNYFFSSFSFYWFSR